MGADVENDRLTFDIRLTLHYSKMLLFTFLHLFMIEGENIDIVEVILEGDIEWRASPLSFVVV